ncbi:unnamed protein product [Linum tenue]|uniref:Uncharacterized protein n=1 Tax=Linum tenue TaxID=586396 RepID=A0AAV0RR28_9ROSI|nr:unnamed protein product [Linum tenue]
MSNTKFLCSFQARGSFSGGVGIVAFITTLEYQTVCIILSVPLPLLPVDDQLDAILLQKIIVAGTYVVYRYMDLSIMRCFFICPMIVQLSMNLLQPIYIRASPRHYMAAFVLK